MGMCGVIKMRYYAEYDENNKLFAIGTGYGGTEITKEQYDALLTEILTKAELVDKLYSNEISLEDVPSEWQEEIQRRVNERIEMEKLLETEEITNNEFINMLEEVL
jgi:hypothetical protein